MHELSPTHSSIQISLSPRRLTQNYIDFIITSLALDGMTRKCISLNNRSLKISNRRVKNQYVTVIELLVFNPMFLTNSVLIFVWFDLFINLIPYLVLCTDYDILSFIFVTRQHILKRNCFKIKINNSKVFLVSDFIHLSTQLLVFASVRIIKLKHGLEWEIERKRIFLFVTNQPINSLSIFTRVVVNI